MRLSNRLNNTLGRALMRHLAIAVALGAAALLCTCGAGDADALRPAAAHVESQLSQCAGRGLAEPDAQAADYDPRQILVVYRDGLTGFGISTPGSTAATMPNACLRRNAGYEALTDAIARRFGLAIRQQVYIGGVNLASFALPQGADGAAVLAALRREFGAQLESAQYDPLHHAHYVPDDPDYVEGRDGLQWGHWQVNCGPAWDVTLGDPQVLIAVVDTGVNIAHEELAQTVIDPAAEFPGEALDVLNGDNTVDDEQGHGTIIAGLIAAQGDNARTIIGAAPHCRVLPVKMAQDLTASTANVIAGCMLAQQLGARVVNLSFGTTVYVQVEGEMVDYLNDHGVLLVCSAGNDNTAVSEYPGAYGRALSVGSTNRVDRRSTFSNYADTVDIAAPGEDLKSCGHLATDGYVFWAWGTSFSAPLVAAAGGLLWSFRPQLTFDEVRSALVTSGAPTQGFGVVKPVKRLEIRAALQSILLQIVPVADGITLDPPQAVGAVVEHGTLTASLVNPRDVSQARYTLDFAPLGVADAYDIEHTGSGADCAASFELPPDLPNQTAELRVELQGIVGQAGAPLSIPVVLYNARGDANCDGLIDAADVPAIAAALGTAAGEPAYSIFADTDLDGAVTEADISAIGYFWRPAT